MKTAYAEFQNLRRAWLDMRTARKGENKFDPYGFKGGRAEDFDALFNEWEAGLARAAARTKPIGADDNALEALIVHIIGQLYPLVSPGATNGFEWLIRSTPFLQKVVELNTALTPILDRRFMVRKAVIEAAKADLVDDIVRVEKASPLAEKLTEAQAQIAEQADEIEEALASTTIAKNSADENAAKIAEHLHSVETITADVASKKSNLDETVDEASELLATIQKTLQSVDASRQSADAKIVDGEMKIAAAAEKLDKTISDINRQGLAGSFNSSASQMGRERLLWLLAFFAALIYLALAASGKFEYLLGITPTTSSEIWERWVHLLPLVAPGIWLGWFSARSAGLSARIQQDYVYKVASAQAFEAHKKEVALHANEKLAAQLLEITIRNFGDNPIRLYDGKGMEGHPLEALKSLVSDKDYFDRFIRVLEAIKPKS